MIECDFLAISAPILISVSGSGSEEGQTLTVYVQFRTESNL